jgi:uncharacterized protein (DUF1810 family)
MTDSDPYNLQRFVDAQAGVYDAVLKELHQGQKRSHWMWFIFPQIRGLGSSAMAQKYALSSLQEAQAYLSHPMLGERLRTCTQLVLNVEAQSIQQIFPYPDDLKFRSCMTLFEQCPGGGQLFSQALAKYFNGQADPLTQEILQQS